MLNGDDYQVRCAAVNKILLIRSKECANVSIQSNISGNHSQPSQSIRRFTIPEINMKAKAYHKLVDMNLAFTEPPAIRHKSLAEIQDILNNPMKIFHPCHNQAVERHVKIVSEAAAAVATFARRDGHIGQKIKSRKLMSRLSTKSDFPTN